MKDNPVFKALGLMGLISVAMGIIVAMPFLIPTLMAGKAVHKGLNYWNDLPSDLVAEPLPQVSTILDKNGHPIAKFYSENRVNVTYDQIAPVMRNAIVAIEDSRFYSHGAIDPKGTLRAFVKTASSNSTQGGSTLTQQYVKNVLLNNADTPAEQKAAIAQTPARKIKEMKLAAGVEHKMTKNQILTAYLNIANFGDGAFGIGSAAMHYFGVPSSKLNLQQAATIAGLVQNPNGYDPAVHPRNAIERRNTVLMRMAQLGKITTAQKEAAEKSPLGLHLTNSQNGCTTSKYAFYCQMVRDTLANDPTFGPTPEAREKFLYKGGLVIHTDLDPKIQDAADSTARSALGTSNQFATSIAVIEPGTGKVLGIGTNRGFGNGKGKTEINYAQSGFQTGSTFKPITLMTALENGWNISEVIDTPVEYCAPRPDLGCFKNAGSADAGDMNTVTAMDRSSNTFFTKLSVWTGTKKVQAMGRRLGLPLPKNLTGHETATTLGVYNVSPIQLANVYATIAAHGKYCTPTWIDTITNSVGKQIKVPQGNCRQAVNPAIADKTAKLLTQVIDGSDPLRTGAKLSLDRPAMGKTGTTTKNSAVWFAGGTPQYQTAVWVGDPRGGFQYPVDAIDLFGEHIEAVFGATAAGPIWQKTMLTVLKGVPVKNFDTSSTIASNRQDTVVPNVLGMSPQSAVKALKAAGLTVTLNPTNAAQDDVYPVNVVAAQSVAGGSTTKLKKSITIQLSSGSTPVKIK